VKIKKLKPARVKTGIKAGVRDYEKEPATVEIPN
jgi:hypothetical protein